MGSYKTNVHILKSIFNLDDKAVIVATDVEDYSVIGENIGCMIIPLDVGRRRPFGLPHVIVPSFQGLFSLGMYFPIFS